MKAPRKYIIVKPTKYRIRKLPTYIIAEKCRSEGLLDNTPFRYHSSLSFPYVLAGPSSRCNLPWFHHSSEFSLPSPGFDMIAGPSSRCFLPLKYHISHVASDIGFNHSDAGASMQWSCPSLLCTSSRFSSNTQVTP